MKSPSWLSPSSPMVWSSEIGSRAYCWISSTFSGVMSISLASSSGVGSRPRSWSSSRWMPAELVDDLDHVHRDADGAGLVGHGAGDGLADPPGGVGGELVALGVVELLDRADQAEVALLDQVQERHPAAGVALGQRHHQPQVGLQQVVLGALAVARRSSAGRAAAAGRASRSPSSRGAQPLGGVEPGLDPLGELDLLLGVEQRDLADLLEVGPDRVGGGGQLGVPTRLLSASDSSRSSRAHSS